MKPTSLLLPTLLVFSSLSAQSWTPLPEPEKTQDELRIVIDSESPLDSLEKQLVDASYEQRSDLATAFDQANRSVGHRIAEFNAQGLNLSGAAADNISEARDFGRQAFRDLSLSTEETWQTSRHNALMALRKIRSSLNAAQRTATVGQN